MEAFVSVITSLVSLALSKKFGMNIGMQLGTLFGLVIREGIKRNTLLLPDVFQSNRLEIKRMGYDDDCDAVFAR